MTAAARDRAGWVLLKPGDRIEALCELEVSATGYFEYRCVSEGAEGLNFAIWVADEEDASVGNWYTIHWLAKLGGWAYDLTSPFI